MCNIIKITEKFLKKYGLFEQKDPFLVGFSGGADSLCLLHILHNLGLNIIAIHLNHNWRGDESLRDHNFCRQFCEENNIKFYSETLPDTVPNNETAARNARYDFFEQAADRFASRVVFTAHNADDNAETLIYRIIKGTGVEGLCGIKEKRGIFYRPLLAVERSDIEKYCADNNLCHITDSSNNDTKYKRNFIRHEILPLIKKINPDAVNALNSLSKVAAEEIEISKYYLNNILTDIGNSTKKFLALPNSVQNKIIYNLFKANNIDYDRSKILNAADFIRLNGNLKSGKTFSLTTDLWLFVSEKEFGLISQPHFSDNELKINKEGEYEFDNFVFSIKKTENLPDKFPDDKECMAFTSLQDINFTLRYRHDGDIIQPLGTAGTQKLKKYFNAKKIPNHKKDKIMLLCQNKEVLWISGFGISEKIKVENPPFYVLKLTNKREVGYGN